MKVKEIMVKNVISARPDDPLTTALNRMRDNKINQLPVVEGGRYVGMLALKDIVTKNVDPAKTKCGNLCTSTPSIRSTDDVDAAIDTMLNAGMRALPVIDDRLVGIISETDVVRSAGKMFKGLMQLPAANIATDSQFVMKDESVAAVKKMMVYSNISRVPVVDGSKVIGVVGTLDMVKLSEGKKELPGRSSQRAEKEKLNIEDTPVTNFMHTPAVISKDATLGDAIAQLAKFEEAFILDEGVKIVTPKDVLELMASAPTKQVHVDVIGMRDESPQLAAKIDSEVNSFAQKMGKMIENIQYVFLHVEKYDKGGKKPLYSVRARFGTPIGMFVARAEDRDPITAVQRVLEDLEKEINRKSGRARDARKKSRIL